MVYKTLYDFQKLGANSKFLGVHLYVMYAICCTLIENYVMFIFCCITWLFSCCCLLFKYCPKFTQIKMLGLSFSSSISFFVNSANSTIFCHKILFLSKLSENYANIQQIGRQFPFDKRWFCQCFWGSTSNFSVSFMKSRNIKF